MKAFHRMGRPERPGFGKPGSVTRETLRGLPAAMQGEGLRLLMEMGMPYDRLPAETGFSRASIGQLLHLTGPMSVGGDCSALDPEAADVR